MPKRKRVVVTLNNKLEIIKCLTNCKLGCVLADTYGLGISTTSDNKKNLVSLVQYAHNFNSADENTLQNIMKTSKNEAVTKLFTLGLYRKGLLVNQYSTNIWSLAM